MNNYIKVYDNENMESAWAYIDNDKLILDNAMYQFEAGTELILKDDTHEIDIISTKLLIKLKNEVIETAKRIKHEKYVNDMKKLVGMRIETKRGKGVVVDYDEDTNRYIVTYITDTVQMNRRTIEEHLI